MSPVDAQVTVIGGGAVGAAATYYLAKAGYTDIQLVEAHHLASATTSQAAGLLGQARTTLDRTRLSMASAQLFRNMERDVGYPSDWRETGSLRIALSDTSVAEIELIASVAAQAGLEFHLVDSAETQRMCPTLEDVSAIRKSLWIPTDGYVQPHTLTQAYAAGARDLGARIITNCRVLDVQLTQGQVTGIVTEDGVTSTEMVVNAAGPWAGALARQSGIELPVVPVLHEYFVTDSVPGWHNGTPCLRIPEIQVYARGEGEGILCGGFEHAGTSLDPTTVDVRTQLPDDPHWDVLGQFATAFARFVPRVSDVGIRTAFRGWPGFTPDGRFLVGPVQGLRGYVMAAGCNAHGVSGSAGLAEHLLDSLSNNPSNYVQTLSPNRFLPRTWDWQDAQRAAQAICENYYPMPGTSIPRISEGGRLAGATYQ